jgi:hypothetical protein
MGLRDVAIFAAPDPWPEEKPEVSNPFYFEDSQVVLQASYDITSYPSTLLTLTLFTGRGEEVQGPSLLPNSRVRVFQ